MKPSYINTKITIRIPLIFLTIAFFTIIVVHAQNIEKEQSADQAQSQNSASDNEYEIKTFGNVKIKRPKNSKIDFSKNFQSPPSFFNELKKEFEDKKLLLKSKKEKIQQGRVVTTTSGAKFITDELIIKYKDNATKKDKQQFRSLKKLPLLSVKQEKLTKLKLERVKLERHLTEAKLKAIIDEFKQDQSVEYAEPNYIAQISTIAPNDPEFSKQWALPKIQAPYGWERVVDASSTVIAVLDTGMDFTHSDRPFNLRSGYDFVNDDDDPQDDHGHGTYVTGIIAAHTNNNEGIAGVCGTCAVIPLKVLDEQGLGTYADVAEAVIYATDQDARVINLSLGGYGYSQALLDAVTYAYDHGASVIAPEKDEISNKSLYPGAYSIIADNFKKRESVDFIERLKVIF